MAKEPKGAAKVGRPKKFKTPEEVTEKAAAYFADCEARNKPITVTGLALALDTTRETLCDYEADPIFSDAIKMAKARVENFAEERLYSSAPTGAIFALKNFGWRDKQELAHSGNLNIGTLLDEIDGSSADLPEAQG